MDVEDLFNQKNIIDLSFYNFQNAITAAYFADRNFEIVRVNNNFKKFFPVLGKVSNAYFPDVLKQLDVSDHEIDIWEAGIIDKGFVLIPQIKIKTDGETRVYSLLSTMTHDDSFSYLNGIQGQFIDRTEEWNLHHEREELLEQKIRDRELIEEKSQQLERLANRLAKYLSPQIYESIFSQEQQSGSPTHRKNLTVFFSDIESFTVLSDTLEPERLAKVINSYLSEMSSIALDCGGTVDKFIGDAIMVFFGDPETEGAETDAIKAIEMALRMQQRVAELQDYWKKCGVPLGLHVRMGISTGYCTVGNFGSEKRLDYTALGSPVNLAARLQSLAPSDGILVGEDTYMMIRDLVECSHFSNETPKGFSRSVDIYQAHDFKSEEYKKRRKPLVQRGVRVEVNVIDSTDIRLAIEELRQIHIDFENRFRSELGSTPEAILLGKVKALPDGHALKEDSSTEVNSA